MPEYKTPAENKRDNKQLKFGMDTPFLVAFVTQIGETIMRTNSNTGEQFPSMLGKYKLYQDEDERVAWIPKWFVKGKQERQKGEILKWEDFKPTYQPDTLEWLVDDYENNTNKIDFQEAMSNTPTPAASIQQPTPQPVAKKEFFSSYDERELRFLLKRNGWTQIDGDVDFAKEKNPNTSTKAILLGLCRTRNVIPASQCLPEVPDITETINPRLEALEKKLDEFTLNGTLTLKDLLSKSKLAKIEEELANAKKDR